MWWFAYILFLFCTILTFECPLNAVYHGMFYVGEWINPLLSILAWIMLKVKTICGNCFRLTLIRFVYLIDLCTLLYLLDSTVMVRCFVAAGESRSICLVFKSYFLAVNLCVFFCSRENNFCAKGFIFQLYSICVH